MATYPKLCHVQSNVLVKRIEDDFGDSLVAPGTMNQEELAKETELTYCNIRTSCGLQALYTADTDSDMSCLDHGHIVGTVSNS